MEQGGGGAPGMRKSLVLWPLFGELSTSKAPVFCTSCPSDMLSLLLYLPAPPTTVEALRLRM